MTGTYQCLRSTRDTPEGRCEEEFTTAVCVYAAAMERKLPELRDLARQQLAKLGQHLNLLTVISVIGDRGETSPSALGTFHPGTVGYLEFRIQSFAETATEAEAKDMLDKLKTPTTLSNIMLRNLFLMKLSTKSKVEEKIGRQTDDPSPAKNSVKLAEKAILEAEDAHQRADQEPDRGGREESPEEEPKETIEDSLNSCDLLDTGATDEELSQFKRRRMA
ncbi:uncharacterized protein B0J16DRAFT_389754 [Fusarium flagelliforme]|uniref:uncharacterized protein n=1 Tax=Fusarium flagelliforme TaxID=2675880 RepID=UPI001E8D687E|nr:uncharacterized protein B0J16DRAFT_389754 [Fusarium flagelliforme]KAH7173869.1 hypothetical protein B0J16DRAFT_389754 [Fusarium flagelliforme]